MEWGDTKNSIYTKTYKRFRVIPCRTYSPGSGELEEWQIAIEIIGLDSNLPGRIFVEKGRSARNEKEAIRLSHEYAEKIIDGLVPGESVANL